MSQTRRLAAILAADVAGYARLMGADEVGTVQPLREHRSAADPIIAEHGGRIVKTTGDGVLIEFGSVVGAVKCALGLQRLSAERNAETPIERRMDWRIGVHIGDVLIEGDDILGDGVNIAARLEGIAEPGGICISEDAFRQVRGKVGAEFEDIGEPELKNIARPVQVFRVHPNRLAGTANYASQPFLASLDKPSVAVLPFANMSADPEQEFIADGIAEDVITALSRYPSLFVIARNSSFTYKGRAVDVKQIGRDLGVRYVLEGSLRKSSNRIRVTAQLVEAGTGRHVWAERYDRDLADIFAVQDEISQAVTIAIAPAIAQAEQQRAMRKPPENIDAWAAYQRGLWHAGRVTAEDNELARQFFQRAIDLDQNFAGGYKGLALTYSQAATSFQTISLVEADRVAEELARDAVAHDGADAEARSCLAWILWRRGNYDAALAEVARALAMAPNLAVAQGVCGAALTYSGRPTEGLRHLESCIRLDPQGLEAAARLMQMAVALYFTKKYKEAVEAAERVIHLHPEHRLSLIWLAAALGQAGRTEEAREALSKAIITSPGFVNIYIVNRAPWVRPEDHAHLLDGLRKAGWSG
jgi:adenylate cyclase